MSASQLPIQSLHFLLSFSVFTVPRCVVGHIVEISQQLVSNCSKIKPSDRRSWSMKYAQKWTISIRIVYVLVYLIPVFYAMLSPVVCCVSHAFCCIACSIQFNAQLA